MFTVTPNYDYESQTEEMKKEVCEKDFYEICNLFHTKREILKRSMICPQCGRRLMTYVKGKNKCVKCQKWFDNPNVGEIKEIIDCMRPNKEKRNGCNM